MDPSPKQILHTFSKFNSSIFVIAIKAILEVYLKSIVLFQFCVAVYFVYRKSETLNLKKVLVVLAQGY